MRILMLGAGSVGQIYGHFLQRGGAEVHVYVRSKYVAEAEAGYPLVKAGARPTTTFKPDGVVTDAEGVAAGKWDQLWLCVSSAGLQGSWLAPLVAAAPGATLVSLLAGLRDREALAALVPPERLVLGVITFSAWHSPLSADDPTPPGMAFWFPPLSPSTFQGGADRVDPIVQTLQAGGCPATRGDATSTTVRGSAFLMGVVAGMEVGGWSFAGLRDRARLALTAGAAREALAIGSASAGIKGGPMGQLMRPSVISLLTRLAPMVTPFDIERFLVVHFTKVGEQTLMAFDAWIDEGRARNLSVAKLEAMRAELKRVRGLQ